MVPSTDKKPSMPDGLGHDVLKFLISGTIVLLASIVFVALRFVSRRLIRAVSPEDWICLAALGFAVGFWISFTLQLTIGRAGFHQIDYSLSQLGTYMKLTLATNTTYLVSGTLVKVSILLFLKRLFAVHESFVRFLLIMIAIVIAYGLGTALATIFFCSPVGANWKFWIPKKCPSAKAFLFSVVIINTVLDVAILISPQLLIWRLQMGWKRKMLVSSLLMVGALACMMSVLRFVALLQIVQDDFTYSATKAQAWSLFELNTAIYCACMPMIPNLFRHWRGKRLTDHSGVSGSSEICVGRPRRTSISNLQDSTEGLYTNIELGDQRSQHDEAKGFSVRVETDIRTHWETTSSRARPELV